MVDFQIDHLELASFQRYRRVDIAINTLLALEGLEVGFWLVGIAPVGNLQFDLCQTLLGFNIKGQYRRIPYSSSSVSFG